MRVLLLSDFHIEPEDSEKTLPWIEHFCTYLNCNYDDQTLIFILGDIVNKGGYYGEKVYAAAGKILEYIESRLDHIPHRLLFLPGNHDYSDENLELFSKYISVYQGTTVVPDFTKRKCWSFQVENKNFLLLDSVQKGKYNLPGDVDLSAVEACIKPECNNILLMHHSLVYEDNGTHTGIINQQEVIEFIRQNNIKFVFHGHAHATRYHVLDSSVLHYGIGSINAKQTDEINEDEQFLEVRFNNSTIESVINWLWRGGANKYCATMLYPDSKGKYQDGSRISRIRYELPQNYIERKVLPRNLATADNWTRYFCNDAKEKLYDVCTREKYVLCIADAGLGKTVEMQSLACIMSIRNPYLRPILLDLNLYYEGSLYDYILKNTPEYSTIDPNQFVLILDGYDELISPAKFKIALTQFCRIYA